MESLVDEGWFDNMHAIMKVLILLYYLSSDKELNHLDCKQKKFLSWQSKLAT